MIFDMNAGDARWKPGDPATDTRPVTRDRETSRDTPTPNSAF